MDENADAHHIIFERLSENWRWPRGWPCTSWMKNIQDDLTLMVLRLEMQFRNDLCGGRWLRTVARTCGGACCCWIGFWGSSQSVLKCGSFFCCFSSKLDQRQRTWPDPSLLACCRETSTFVQIFVVSGLRLTVFVLLSFVTLMIDRVWVFQLRKYLRLLELNFSLQKFLS